VSNNQYFHEYYAEWMVLYKQGAVSPITYEKYLITQRWLAELAPVLKICELDKRGYQNLINEYAKTHERQTTMDFHRYLKSAILDAKDEGLLDTDPTRKIAIKGKPPSYKKPKFLSKFELIELIKALNLADKLNWDWFILLLAKTGMRFAEALGLTLDDFDFTEQKIKVNKTWNYKDVEGAFAKTKNDGSKRIISIDTELSNQFRGLFQNGNYHSDKPVFVNGRVFNSTVNGRLEVLCKKAGIPVIALHSLRHTHASLLIYAGVSIASIAKRLGHSNMTTTQEVYLHIIKELEDKDNEKIINHLSELKGVSVNEN
jgi:integrase